MKSDKRIKSHNSVKITGSVTDSSVIAGTGNTVSYSKSQSRFEDIDLKREISLVNAIFLAHGDPVLIAISKRLEQEALADVPDKGMIGKTIESALHYTKTLSNFTSEAENLRPHVSSIAKWLGQYGTKLISLMI